MQNPSSSSGIFIIIKLDSMFLLMPKKNYSKNYMSSSPYSVNREQEQTEILVAANSMLNMEGHQNQGKQKKIVTDNCFSHSISQQKKNFQNSTSRTPCIAFYLEVVLWLVAVMKKFDTSTKKTYICSMSVLTSIQKSNYKEKSQIYSPNGIVTKYILSTEVDYLLVYLLKY